MHHRLTPDRIAAPPAALQRCPLPLALLLVAALGSMAHAAPHDWAEGTPGLDDGATRDFYNRGAHLPWRNPGTGDWRDREGTPQGSDAWATRRVDDTDTERWIEWDVTELVQGWAAGADGSQGVMLRGLGGGGPIDFSSREGTHAAELVVNGVSQEAIADTFLNGSTYTQQGHQERLRIRPGEPALIRFDVAALPATVSSATLRVFTTAQYGGGLDIGVFEPRTADDPPPTFEVGLAEDYPMDEGIGGDPAVLFFEGFEASDWQSHWTSVRGNTEAVESEDEAFGFAPLRGRALRTWVPEGGHTGLDMHWDFMEETGAEPDEIYLRYYIRLGDTWNQTADVGKLPGLSGTYGEAGWGGRRATGTDGWSARGLYELTIPGANPLAGRTPIGSYIYHADMEAAYGDTWVWNERWGPEGHGGILARERWHCIEVQVRMNTPGANDGVVRAWVDGRRSFEKADFRFRDVERLHIERVWMNIYHGGRTPSPANQHAFIDHVVVSRRYVGPMADTDPSPTTDGGVAAPPDGGVASPGDAAPPDGRTAGDAASGADAGTMGAGCGCRVSSTASDAPSTSLGLLFGLVAIGRWRHRVHRSASSASR
jgi:MYXO-CTERM domain-containing protein